MKEGMWAAVKPEQSSVAGEAMQQQALGMLRMHVADHLLEAVGDCQTAREAWMRLEAQYKQRAGVQQLQLRQDWAQFKQRSGESVTEYAARLRTAATALRAAGKEVDEEDQVMTLLRGLTNAFSTVRALFKCNPAMAKDVEAIMPVLLAHEPE